MEPCSLFTWPDSDGDHSLDLSVKCDECDGLGKVVNMETETFGPCPDKNCNHGAVITGYGQFLLKFIRDFQNHPSATAEL